MTLDEFKLATKEQLIEYGKLIPLGRTKNFNNTVSYKYSNGYWGEYEYDFNGNVLSFIDVFGYWNERTYIYNDNDTSYKDSKGFDYKCICIGKHYNLLYDFNKKLYRYNFNKKMGHDGCQTPNYKECIDFFNRNENKYIDAKLFMRVIEYNLDSFDY